MVELDAAVGANPLKLLIGRQVVRDAGSAVVIPENGNFSYF